MAWWDGAQVLLTKQGLIVNTKGLWHRESEVTETWNIALVSKPTLGETDSVRLERLSDPTEPKRSFCLNEDKKKFIEIL